MEVYVKKNLKEAGFQTRPCLVAELLYDTRAQGLPTGVRAVTQRGRSLLYSADAYEIMLQVSAEPSPDRVKLMGQVLQEGLPLPEVTIRLDGPAARVDQLTDSEGEFRLSEL